MKKFIINPAKEVNYSGCQKGLHPFKIITSHSLSFDREEVVRWCPKCGAVVVDMDYDNRTSPGYYREIDFPEITTKYGYENYNVSQKQKTKTKVKIRRVKRSR